MGLIGGKAAQLQVLADLGLPVPPFVVLGPDDALDVAAVRAVVGPGPVAVRSSASGEDAAGKSFAGQFDTVLCVDGDAALAQAVDTVRASVDSERVRAYCQHHGVDPAELRMALVVQRMFPSAAAGVLFTCDPADPARPDVLVSAGWGLGEGVVSGLVDTDTFRVGPDGIAAEIADKRQQVVAAPGGGTHAVDVPEAERHRPCLSDAQLHHLADLGRTLEAHFGVPQDVEWAADEEGALALLQTRPLTGVGPRTGRVTTWDNSNIIESYAGVTTPLTYTFARRAYEVVYRQFCEVMGVPDEVIEDHAPVFGAMIGLIRGRIFYRLDSWYQVLSLLPGAAQNRRFMEQMMGVKKEAEMGEGGRMGRLRILYLAWRMVRALGGLGRRTAEFRSIFAEAYAAYADQDLDALPPEALVSAYRDLERRLLLNWKAPIINDFFAMIFFGVLKKLAGGRHDDLLCGEPGMESTLPTRETMAMAARVRDDPALREALEATPDDTALLARLRAGDAVLRPLTEWLDDYLRRFGDRCMEELKLETPTLRDDPSFILRMLRSYIDRPDLTVAALQEREHRVRREAEAQIRVPWLRRPLFRWILRRARRHVRERENLRFARTRVFGLVRTIFRSLGAHLTRAGLLDDPQDVFHLTVDELLGAVGGTTPSVALRDLCRVRRAEFDRYRAMPAPDDRFETRGGVHLGNVFRSLDPAPATDDTDVLHGLGCAPGVVRAEARIVHSPKDDLRLDGRILCCERTDPGWVPLFPTAAGLLVERGSALSHSAIVAREFGIPTVVGIPGLLRRVQDGQVVELDGHAGTVRLEPGDA